MRKPTRFITGFPDRLAEAIKTSGLTCAQISKIVGRNRKMIYDYKNGHHSPDAVVLAKLCKLLNVSADWLLFGEKE